MTPASNVRNRARWITAPLVPLALAGIFVACGKSSSSAPVAAAPVPGGGPMAVNAQITAPKPDPRVGLKPGTMDARGQHIVTPAAEAIWNMRMVSHTPLPPAFETATTSDLAFSGNNVIQGNYNGFLVWDVSNPSHPMLKVGDECPASQDDVSVYGHLLFVSAESGTSRLDCGKQGVQDPVSKDRIRGVRIFDMSDIAHPKQLAAVQTCRGSHTHTVVTDPKDPANVYIYISGTSQPRSAEELPGCVNSGADDPNTVQFRIEVIRVPLAHPEQAAIVSSPRIFSNGANVAGLVNPGSHGAAPVDTTQAACDFAKATADKAAADAAAAAADPTAGRGGRGGRGGGRGGAAAAVPYADLALSATATKADTARAQHALDSLKTAGVLQTRVTLTMVSAGAGGRGGRGRGAAAAPAGGPAAPCAVAGGRGGRGGGGAGATIFTALLLPPTATAVDSGRVSKSVDSLKTAGILQPGVTLANFGGGRGGRGGAGGRGAGPVIPRGTLTQCHDITAYPAVGLAGGACAGMGLLLDIHDAAHPQRLDAYADSNFSFWHSATFSNDGSMMLFSDEWGGGSAAYCRATDPKNWGADALFKIVNGKLVFQSYYKLPAAQTPAENCVAHNGSLIPIPGRTIMVQAFYQGGLTMFEWTDPAHPKEIGFFDRGPYASYFVDGGFWSVYWYNGYIYGSEIKRGLDVFELTPSAAISQNEIDAAKTVHFAELNVQDQPKFVWPASFALARAYADQLERNKGMAAGQIASTRSELAAAEKLSGSAKRDALSKLATELVADAKGATDQAKAGMLASAVNDLAKM